MQMKQKIIIIDREIQKGSLLSDYTAYRVDNESSIETDHLLLGAISYSYPDPL